MLHNENFQLKKKFLILFNKNSTITINNNSIYYKYYKYYKYYNNG